MKRERANDDRIRQTLVERGRWASRWGFDRYHTELFRGVDFRGRRVLDVGGGIGTCSFLAVAAGATEAICLDPEAEGATSGTGAIFDATAADLGITNAHIAPKTLQSYVAPPGSFDVVIFHNSINHVEEAACVELRRSEAARRTYRAVFAQVAELCRPGADLIIADCSSENLFPRLGLRHPISKSIEWEKHQPPEVWAKELVQVGFVNPQIRWTSYTRLGKLGWALTANRWAAYVLTGHFILHMQKR